MPSSVGPYDAVLGVSGGKDSTRQAIWAKEALGLRILLVSVVYPDRRLTNLGARNLTNLLEKGFDCVLVQPRPETSRLLFAESFKLFGNAFKATELALFSGPQRLAIEMEIPLVLWGENPALQVGDYAVLGQNLWDGNSIRFSNTLKGGDRKWIQSAIGASNPALEYYKFPDIADLAEANVNVIYLGGAFSDWGSLENGAFSILEGFAPNLYETEFRSDLYRSEQLDERLQIVNLLVKFFKFGFGTVSEQLSAEVRRERVSRDEAFQVARKYEGLWNNSDIEDFCWYANMRVSEFWDIVRQFGDHDLFDFSSTPPRPTSLLYSG